jgi:hypothetical protein
LQGNLKLVTVTGEVDYMGPVLVEGLQEVVRSDGPKGPKMTRP